MRGVVVSAALPSPTCWPCALLLAACGPGGGVGAAGIDTTGLWPAEEGAFLAYRHLTAEEYEDPDQADVLDESDLLLSRYEAGGCGDTRIELRTGASWANAAPLGALHVEAGLGLAICGHEAEDGTLDTFDPAIPLWVRGSVLDDGGVTEGEGWAVTARRAADVPTYFGVFPETAVFTLEGAGPLDGWELHLAEGFGLVVLSTETYTADLVYTR